jgi:Gamma-glutamyl cyclotransferase, AIG2-like
MRFFFYGTLLDRALLRAVLGPEAERLAIAPARLRNWRRFQLRRKTYPMMSRAPGRVLAGIIVSGISDAGAARLAAYEGRSFGVAAAVVECADGERLPVRVFVPLASTYRGDLLSWNEAVWRRRHQRRTLAKARRIAHLNHRRHAASMRAWPGSGGDDDV